jgi:hypothetical protein
MRAQVTGTSQARRGDLRIAHAHEKADEAALSHHGIDPPCATADRSPQLLGGLHDQSYCDVSTNPHALLYTFAQRICRVMDTGVSPADL